MAFKKPKTVTAAPESPDLLFKDLPQRKLPSLYDHQGQILRSYKDNYESNSDVAIQLPTGSGKTLVGLLLAEWIRRKNNENILYLCPTKQLVQQVTQEAKEKYGIRVQSFIGSSSGYGAKAKASYEDNQCIGITTYSSIFNTNPYFKNPNVIILDDAHTSENYIASQWSLHIRKWIPDDAKIFNAIASVIKNIIPLNDFNKLINKSPHIDKRGWVDKLPTHLLLEIKSELCDAIDEHIKDSNHRYPWSEISDNILACQFYFSVEEILIRPIIPPTWMHEPFNNARQRIYMSATLGLGGDLERLTGRKNIARLPVPTGWDSHGVGRRFFVFPEKSLDDNETSQLALKMMKISGRSLVLTSSNKKAENFVSNLEESEICKTLSFKVFTSNDIESDKKVFTCEENAVAVMANRYDGVDFAGDDCRLLFVDGLPKTTNLQESFLMSRLGSGTILNERIKTRVSQAIGRCTRGSNDYAAIMVSGHGFSSYLTNRNQIKTFHPELQAEIRFGLEQSQDVTVDDIVDNFQIFLAHSDEWEEANTLIIENREESEIVSPSEMTDLSEVVNYEIDWQKALWHKDFVLSFDMARETVGRLKDSSLRGYRALWHYLAGSSALLADYFEQKEMFSVSREHFSLAKKAAPQVPWLVALSSISSSPNTEAENLRSSAFLQIENLEQYFERLGTLTNSKFSSKEDEIRTLLYDLETFEQGQVILGIHLGYETGKVEVEASPDPWWSVGHTIIVFEDYVEASPESSLSPTKARQASSHPDWMREHVDIAKSADIIQSTIVSPIKRAHKGAMPHLKNVAFWDLEDFQKWVEEALITIRDLRRSFIEKNDLEWRKHAYEIMVDKKIDICSLVEWLMSQSAYEILST